MFWGQELTRKSATVWNCRSKSKNRKIKIIRDSVGDTKVVAGFLVDFHRSPVPSCDLLLTLLHTKVC